MSWSTGRWSYGALGAHWWRREDTDSPQRVFLDASGGDGSAARSLPYGRDEGDVGVQSCNWISGANACDIRRWRTVSRTLDVLDAIMRFLMVIGMYVRERGANSRGTPPDHIFQRALHFPSSNVQRAITPYTLARTRKIVQGQ